jgi:arginyl-tRNA synthetase
MSASQPKPPEKEENEEINFEQALAELEEYLIALKERYGEIQRAEQQRNELLERQQELRQQQNNNTTKEPIKTELKYLQEQLEELELHLESRLLTWGSFKEPFWQAVRFGGLGVVIGWLLKSCAG